MEALLRSLVENQTIGQDAAFLFMQQHNAERAQIRDEAQKEISKMQSQSQQQPQTPPGLVPTHQDRPLFEVKNFDRVDKFDGNGSDYQTNCAWRHRWKGDYRRASFGSTGVPDINE